MNQFLMNAGLWPCLGVLAVLVAVFVIAFIVEYDKDKREYESEVYRMNRRQN